MTVPASRLDADAIRESLRIEDIVQRYNLDARQRGPMYRLAECPRCGHRSSSRAITINIRKRTWGHFGAGKPENGRCFGDWIDLIAACEGLDTRRDFRRALGIAAELAGVTAATSDEDRERRQRDRIERDRRQAEDDASADTARRASAIAAWPKLLLEHEAGERYMRARGLEPRGFVDAGLVRFGRVGDVCVRLHSLDDGELVTVTRRLIALRGGGLKCLTPEGGTTRGTLCGSVLDVGARDTVITEGIFDTLTAIAMWPEALVLGAAGAGQLAAIAATAAPRVRAHRGRLVLVPHSDDNMIGQRQAIRAGEAALDAGLVLGRDLVVRDVSPHNDLNDAHRGGWKP